MIVVEDALLWGKETVMLWLQEFMGRQPVGAFRYIHEDEAKTEVLILDKNDVTNETTDKRPALAISVGGTRAGHRTIGDKAEDLFEEGAEEYIDTYSQMLTVSCMSTVGLEAQKLASIVFSGFQYNVKTIMGKGFTKVRPLGTGDEITISVDSKADIISAPVTVELSYTVKWKIRESNPVLLGSIGFELNFD